jgi:peptidoglycan-N-acetylglucosamine deacetylase
MSTGNGARGPGAAGAGPWPEGFRAAAALTFDVDAESVMLASDPSLAARASLMSHQRYGPQAGVPRILRLLAGRGVRATFFVPGYTAEQHPDAVLAIRDAGHEIAHHGYLHELLTGAGEAAEREYLERGLEALDRVAGVRPAGYRAPWWETTDRTLDLLVEYGFSFDSSLFDADLPYVRQLAGGPITEIPVSWALDDWEKYAFWPGVTGTGTIERPSRVAGHWWEEVLAYAEEGACCVITMHPFLSGRPARAKALGGLIDQITEHGEIWLAPMGEIASRVMAAAAPAPAPGRATMPFGQKSGKS